MLPKQEKGNLHSCARYGIVTRKSWISFWGIKNFISEMFSRLVFFFLGESIGCFIFID